MVSNLRVCDSPLKIENILLMDCLAGPERNHCSNLYCQSPVKAVEARSRGRRLSATWHATKNWRIETIL